MATKATRTDPTETPVIEATHEKDVRRRSPGTIATDPVAGGALVRHLPRPRARLFPQEQGFAPLVARRDR
jgi:hypothetical protein